jgi:IclR family KDG regulon transcriptional repressor
VPSLEKIHAILELLRENSRQGLTNKEISRALKLPPSTCYRILAALKRHDYVYQRKPDLRYFLGFAHLRFAESVLEGTDEAAVCLPYLEELHRRTEETTFFARFNGTICIAMVMCGHINTRISVGRGEIMPLYCSAVGKAVLAFLPEKTRKNLLESLEPVPHTSYTIVDKERLAAELVSVNACGVGYCLQEFHNGINALGTPIFGRMDQVVGALGLVGTSVDLDNEQLAEYAQLFLEASSDVTAVLGGRFPERLLVQPREGIALKEDKT